MKNLNKFLVIGFFSVSMVVSAEETELDKDVLFKGVTEQSHSYTCGGGALATLINGTFEGSHISEDDIDKTVTEINGGVEKDTGYNATELLEAARKLGYKADWQYVEPSFLVELSQPVILLIGLNSKFKHYTVLKGIDKETGMAFLADPTYGNVRVLYKDLIAEGINEKYKNWYVMAVQPSENKPKDSNLYLSSEKYNTHFTVEQSSAVTLATVSKKNQVIANYDFMSSLGSSSNGGFTSRSRNFTHGFGVRYGVTENAEIGGNFAYSDDRQKIKFDGNSITANSENRSYEIYANNKFSLTDTSGIILGGRTSFEEYASIWGGGVNLTGYTNTAIAQFIVGGSVNKQFRKNDIVDANLPEYQVSGFVSANKPIGDRYLGSLSFSVNDAFSKSSSVAEFNPSYTVSTGLTYTVNTFFQVTPQVGYSFGSDSDAVSFGASFAYVGGW
jgi:predicted double-glycine peptidase